MITCMCGYKKEATVCQIIPLSPKEKKDLIEAGHQEVQDQYYCCKPCWRLMQDPEKAPLFMRNSYEQQLKQFGVPHAKKLADMYYKKLIELQRKATHGTQA